MQIHKKPLAFVDVETTGGSATRDRVIEIGVIRVEDGKIVRTLDTLVNPLTRIPAQIVRMTGIHDEDVARAPLFDEVSSELRDILDGSVFVAHNARFDYGFIKNELLRQGVGFSAKTLCTVRLSRRVFPGLPSYSLGNLIDHFGFEVASRHRAYDDAYVMYQLIERAVEVIGLEGVRGHVRSLLSGPTIPSQLSKEKVRSLPEGPGVYKFVSDDTTLYIGKSVNLKRRVMNHFNSDYKVSTDSKICRYSKDVEVRPTAGEIGALIRESQMIKEEQPIYNRVLRRRSELVVLFREDGERLGGRLERVPGVGVEQIERVLGVFKSLKSAKERLYEISGEYGLCPYLLGLEKTSPCFNYKLGKCGGVCVSEGDGRSISEYNLRFFEAFSGLGLRQWPFEGAVAIVEKNGDLEEQHLVDKWCYLGSVEISGGELPKKSVFEPVYDYDIYKILARRIFGRGQAGIRSIGSTELEEMLS